MTIETRLDPIYIFEKTLFRERTDEEISKIKAKGKCFDRNKDYRQMVVEDNIGIYVFRPTGDELDGSYTLVENPDGTLTDSMDAGVSIVPLFEISRLAGNIPHRISRAYQGIKSQLIQELYFPEPGKSKVTVLPGGREEILLRVFQKYVHGASTEWYYALRQPPYADRKAIAEKLRLPIGLLEGQSANR